MSASPHYFRHNDALAPTVPVSRLQPFSPLLVVMLLLVLLYYAKGYLGDAVRFPVSRVEIGGKLAFVDRPQLMSIVKRHTRLGFFGLSIGDVREEVIALPWVKEAFVRRVLPDRMHIDIVEREAAMQWNDTGLIDDQGEVFYPPQLALDHPQLPRWQSEFSALPHLRGGLDRAQDLQQAFSTYQRTLQGQVPGVIGLYEDVRQSRTLLLRGNVLVRLGYERVKERLERFKHLFPQYLTAESASGLQFDMRYTNGFTVARVEPLGNLMKGYN